MKNSKLYRDQISLISLLEHSGIGLIEVNLKKEVLRVSNSLYSLLDLKEDHTLSIPDFFKNHVHPEDQQFYKDLFSGCYCLPGSKKSFESKLINQKKEEVLVSINGKLLLDESGEIEAWAGLIYDITEKQKTLLSEKKANEIIKLIRQEAKIRTWEYDEKTDSISMFSQSPGSEEVKSVTVTREEYAKRILNSRDAAIFLEKSKKAIIERTSFETNFEVHDYFKPDDHPVWIYVSGRALPEEEAGKVKFSGITLDITEIKALHSELMEKSEMLQLALRSAKIAYWDWNPRDNILEFDREWFQQIDVIGKDDTRLEAWMEALHPGDVKYVEKQIMEHLTGKTPYYEALMRLKTISGPYRSVVAKGKIIKRDENGQPIKFVGVHVDLTELMELKSKIEEQKIQLAEAAKLAGLGVMAQGVQHELNNALNFLNGAFYGFRQLIQEHCPNEKKEHVAQLTTIMESGLSISKEVIRSLKANNELSSTNKKSSFNVKEVIERALILTRSRLTESKVTVDIPSNIKVNGSETAFMQVCMNLLINAADAISGKQGLINIIGEITQLRGLDMVQLKFEDNGCGISKENLAKLYGPFFTTKPKGNGLGMFVVKNEVDKMNGVIAVESEIDKGTTFIISLPIV